MQDESTAETLADDRLIGTLEQIPPTGTLWFEVRASRFRTEAILCHTGDSVSAWQNSCPHDPEVKLDRGFGAFVIGGQLVCHKHGARFNCDDGFCTHGPCRGCILEPIAVTVHDDEVYLTDDRFDSCRPLGEY
ncbi:Rieske (2Fe-2S) protein [Haloarchaeobius sp. TZWWS8]|uniref:Rieske (2Fe-2S) protein n=1 Tax=Haloarchaeobius sp. TZWWS8 TaxID=3446121 RepID=UPI003EBDF7B7